MQTERAFTPPLLANMGTGAEPDTRRILNPRMLSFNAQSWARVVEEVSAHPVGGLRFTSFRYKSCACKRFVCIAAARSAVCRDTEEDAVVCQHAVASMGTCNLSVAQ